MAMPVSSITNMTTGEVTYFDASGSVVDKNGEVITENTTPGSGLPTKDQNQILTWGSFTNDVDAPSKTIYGLEADVPQLPTAKGTLKSGTTAYCVDTRAVYIYLSTTEQWYKQG